MITKVLYNREVKSEQVSLGNLFYSIRTSHSMSMRETAYKLDIDVNEVRLAEQGILNNNRLEELIRALKHICQIR